MKHDPSPLKYLGTQSQETVNMATALALRAAEHPATDLRHTAAGTGRDDADASSRLGDAASWAVDKAVDALRGTALLAGRRATTALGDYARRDPVRAMLMAAAAGALLVGYVEHTARSGARAVKRSIGAA